MSDRGFYSREILVRDGHIRLSGVELRSVAVSSSSPMEPGTSRRDAIHQGAKLALAAPVVSTFFARQAYAVNYSCYAEGHECVGAEPCCEGLACNNGVCLGYCVPAGEPYFTDSDCNGGDCRLGTCQ